MESFINMVAIEEIGSESEKKMRKKILANNNNCLLLVHRENNLGEHVPNDFFKQK